MDDKLDLILQKLEVLETRLDTLETGQKALETGQKALESSQVALESGQKEIHLLSRAILTRQEVTDAKLEALTMDVHNLHGEIAEIIESQLHMVKNFETLAMRSIEHETEIRELKRVK